jgi:predicted proteasome-type protease
MITDYVFGFFLLVGLVYIIGSISNASWFMESTIVKQLTWFTPSERIRIVFIIIGLAMVIISIVVIVS